MECATKNGAQLSVDRDIFSQVYTTLERWLTAQSKIFDALGQSTNKELAKTLFDNESKIVFSVNWIVFVKYVHPSSVERKRSWNHLYIKFYVVHNGQVKYRTTIIHIHGNGVTYKIYSDYNDYLIDNSIPVYCYPVKLKRDEYSAWTAQFKDSYTHAIIDYSYYMSMIFNIPKLNDYKLIKHVKFLRERILPLNKISEEFVYEMQNIRPKEYFDAPSFILQERFLGRREILPLTQTTSKEIVTCDNMTISSDITERIFRDLLRPRLPGEEDSYPCSQLSIGTFDQTTYSYISSNTLELLKEINEETLEVKSRWKMDRKRQKS